MIFFCTSQEKLLRKEKDKWGRKIVDRWEKGYIVGSMKTLNLCLHCGGSTIDRQELEKIQTPEPTGRWYPISHELLLNMVEAKLNELGMRIVEQTYGVANAGKRLFGILQIANGHTDNDHSWVAGIRNSHDKMFPAGLCVGSGVFVCDNLAFSSEIAFGRKHTLNIVRDLPSLVSGAVSQLAEKWDTQSQRIEQYKKTGLGNKEAGWLILQAMKEGVFPKTRITDILEEWLTPRHTEFRDRNVWSLFNAVTECLKPKADSKGNSLWDLPARTNRLHSLCDAACGIDIASLKSANPTA